MKDSALGAVVTFSILLALQAVAGGQNSAAVGLSGSSTSSIDTLRSNGDGTFTRVTVPAIYRSAAIASADLNGDGRADFVIGSPAAVNPCVLLSRCDGGYDIVFLTVDPPVVAGGSLPATGDLDGDGFTDVVFTFASGPTGFLVVYLNDGTGHFGSPLPAVATETSPRSIAVVDFGGGSALDVAVATEGGSTHVHVFANDGTGTLSLAFAFDGAEPKNIVAADFDRDGLADIAVTHRSPGDVSVYEGIGSHGVMPALVIPVLEAWGIVADDFDGDLYPDLGVAGFGSENLTILRNDSTPSISFSPAGMPIALGGRGANGIASFDFDADGKRDLAVVLQDLDEVVVFRGDGSGAFAESSREAVGDAPEYVAAYQHVPPACLEAVGPAIVWIGLKNSDDIGIRFDLRAELLVNGTLVACGDLESVPGGSSGFNNAHERSIPMTLVSSPVGLAPGDVVSLSVYVRNAASGSGKNSGTARLWFNDAAADSRVDWTVSAVSSSRYLVEGFVLSPAPGVGPKLKIDVAAGQKGSPFKLIGTWSLTIE